MVGTFVGSSGSRHSRSDSDGYHAMSREPQPLTPRRIVPQGLYAIAGSPWPTAAMRAPSLGGDGREAKLRGAPL